jgi:hypothetical protein
LEALVNARGVAASREIRKKSAEKLHALQDNCTGLGAETTDADRKFQRLSQNKSNVNELNRPCDHVKSTKPAVIRGGKGISSQTHASPPLLAANAPTALPAPPSSNASNKTGSKPNCGAKSRA